MLQQALERVSRAAASPAVSRSTTEHIQDRVTVLRAEGRRRRRLVQLPPLVSGSVSGMIGVLLIVLTTLDRGASPTWHALVGMVFIHTGPWLAIFALRPQDRRAVRTLLVLFTILGMGGGVSVVPDFISIFGDVARTSPNAGQLLSGSADGLIMVACATACATWIQTLVRDLCWGAPARQAFSRLYLAVGLLYVLCGCAYAAYALSLLHFSTYVLWTARDGPPFAGLAVVVFALGCGTFWQPLRTEVRVRPAATPRAQPHCAPRRARLAWRDAPRRAARRGRRTGV